MPYFWSTELILALRRSVFCIKWIGCTVSRIPWVYRHLSFRGLYAVR